MSDVLRRSKKALSLALTVSTIVWSIGLFAFLPAFALTANAAAGDLVKSANSSAVYLVGPSGTTIHVFPHENVFKSWGYTDFRNVTTVDLSGYTVGNPVSFRDGSLFRGTATGIQGKDKTAVFVVSGGKIRDILSEAVYQGLYNDASWNRVTWVPDDLLSKFNYPLGTQVASSATYPDGTLLKVSGSSTVYLVTGGQRRAFSSSAALSANRYMSAGAVVVAQSVLDGISAGSAVTSMESTLATPTVADIVGGVVDTGPKGTGLTVSLASDTPVAASIVSDNAGTSNGAQALAPVAKFNFTASSDGAVTVTTVKFVRGGISADSDISNAYLYDGDMRVAANPSISSTVLTFTNSAGIFTVPAGSTKAITLKFDIINSATSGKTITFRINSASDVTTNGATVNGSFPQMGNTFTTANVTDLGKLTMANSAPTSAANVDAGQTGYEIWRYTWAGSNQDIEVRKIAFTIVGSLIKGDLRNFSLYDGGTLVAGPVEDMSDTKTVTFTPSPAFRINAGVTKTMSLRADIVTGSNHTFYASLQNASDVQIYDRNYNVFLKEDGTDTFTIEQAGGATSVNYTISAGTLTVNKAADAPSGNAALAATGVTIGKFDFKATGEAVKISSLLLWLKSGGTTGAYANLKNGKLFVDGAQIGTTQTLSKTSTTTFTLGSSLIIPAGATKSVSVVADLVVNSGTALAANDTLIVVSQAGSANAQGQTSLTSLNAPGANIDANTLTIKSGTVSNALNSGLANASVFSPTGVIGQQNVKISSFVVNAGAGEAADVTQIVVKNSATAGLALVNDFSNLSVKTSTGAAFGTAQATASGASTTYTFTPGQPVTVAAGGTLVLDVYADILSSATNTSSGAGVAPYTAVILDSVTATGKTTGTSATDSTDVNGQNVYIAGAGTMTVAQDADTPIANIVQMSQAAIDKQIDVYKFKLTATNEDMLVTRVILNSAIASNAGGATTTVATSSLVNFELYDTTGGTSTQIGQRVQLTSSVNPTNGGYVDFNGLNYTIPKNSTHSVTLKAYINRYDGASSGSTHTFSIAPRPLSDGSTRAITARGAASSVDVSGPTATSTGNALTIRRNYPVVQFVTPPTQRLSSNQAGTVLYKFTVGAQPGSQSIRIKKMTFRLTMAEEATTTNALTLQNFRLVRDGVDKTNYVIWGQATTTATNTPTLLSGTNTLAWSSNITWLGTQSNIASGAVSTSTLITVFFGASGIQSSASPDASGGEEEIGAGGTVTYELKADISGGGTGTTEDGDFVTVAMPAEPTSSVTTGNLAYQTGYETVRVGTTQSYFVWSDMASENSHTYAVPSTGSDWTTGYQVRTSATSNQYLPLASYTIPY